jgi:hypothetical protein
LQPKEVLREEREVYPNKHDKELSLGPPLRQGSSCDGGESKGHSGEDSKHGPHGEDVMEVCDHIIGIMQRNI